MPGFGKMGARGGFGSAGVLGKAGPSTPSYVTDVLSINSLVGYWRATDAVGSATIKDFSASNVPATIAGGVTLGSTALISGQSSALFNGTTGTASLGAAGETLFHNYERTQAFTIEAIIRPNLARTTNFFVDAIFSKFDNNFKNPGIRIGVQYLTADSKAHLDFTLMNSVNGGFFMDAHGSTDLANGSNWHVVISYDGSGVGAGVKMWVNGVPETMTVTTDTLGAHTIINSVVPHIGSIGGVANFFHGNIEELAIYNSAASATTSTLMASNVLDAGKPGYHAGLALSRAPIATISVPNVIFDNQFTNDIDSYSGLAMAAALHLRGEINLIGIVENSINDKAADAAWALLKYMIPATPKSFVGAWQGAVPSTGNAGNSSYSADISATFGTNASRTTFTDGVQWYRALLASRPDNSVVIVGMGYFTTLDGLLTSAANAGGDGLPSGAALIASKVKRLVLCCGLWPNSSGYGAGNNPEFNLVNGPSANASDVFANWPTEILISGVELGGQIAGTGTAQAGPANTNASATNPLQQAWHDWVVAGGSSPRNLWDEIAILAVARGPASGSSIAGLRGTSTVNSSTGANTWSPTAGNVSYMRKSAADAAFVTLVNSMYAALPSPF